MKGHIVALIICALIINSHCDNAKEQVVKEATPSKQSIVVHAQDTMKNVPKVQSKPTHTQQAKPIQTTPTKQIQPTLQQSKHQEVNLKQELLPIQKNEAKQQRDPQLAKQVQQQAQIEQQKEQQQLLQQQALLKPWIADQMQNLNQQVDGIITQSVQFILDPQKEYSFRWNPPKTQQLSLSVLVFQILQNGQITMQHDLQEDEFILVQSREQGKHIYNRLGIVYVSKVFHINFDTDFKYFRFVSQIPKSVLLVVDLQKLSEIVPNDIAKDKHFLNPLQKLTIIQEQIVSGQKMREHTYKYEWGFLDNQYTHDSRLLGFTGLQLVVIIGASVLQLYFIKSLLDNRAIV